MCGRYTLAGDWSELQREFELEEVPGLEPRYNIAPSARAGYEAPVIVEPGRLVSARFWYIPSWWVKNLKDLPTTFNARSESVDNKAFFQGYRPCLIPTSGWREFPGPVGNKRAFHFYLADSGGAESFFAFAGVASRWFDPRQGREVTTFSILTGEPGALVRPFHHRMPLVVPRDQYANWLSNEVTCSDDWWQRLRSRSIETDLQVRECSTYGNSTRASGAACIAAPNEQGSLF